MHIIQKGHTANYPYALFTNQEKSELLVVAAAVSAVILLILTAVLVLLLIILTVLLILLLIILAILLILAVVLIIKHFLSILSF